MKKIMVLLLVVGLVATPGFAKNGKKYRRANRTATARSQEQAKMPQLEHKVKLAEFEVAYKGYKSLLALRKKAVSQEKELDALLNMAAAYLQVWGIDGHGKGIAYQRFGGNWRVHGKEVNAMDFLREQAALLPEGQEQQAKYASLLESAQRSGREYRTLQEMYEAFLKKVEYDIQTYIDIQNYYQKKSRQTSDSKLERRGK